MLFTIEGFYCIIAVSSLKNYSSPNDFQVRSWNQCEKCWPKIIRFLFCQQKNPQDFSNNHIKPIPFNAKIVGRHPLQIFVSREKCRKFILKLKSNHKKVHQNGSFSGRDPTVNFDTKSFPAKTYRQVPISYFLETLENSIEIYSKKRPKRVFTCEGVELTQIGQLKHEQHVFISFGEEFQAPFGSLKREKFQIEFLDFLIGKFQRRVSPFSFTASTFTRKTMRFLWSKFPVRKTWRSKREKNLHRGSVFVSSNWENWNLFVRLEKLSRNGNRQKKFLSTVRRSIIKVI